MIAPETCTNMAEVRAGVDAIDAEIVALLARRFGFKSRRPSVVVWNDSDHCALKVHAARR